MIISDNKLINTYKRFIETKENIIVFSPYIKLSALKKLFCDSINKVDTIITTWKPLDIKMGASDLSVYTFCNSHNIKMMINNDIHLKCILDYGYSSCIVSSANITNRGLAMANKFNYELGSIVSDITIDDKLYFDQIIENSILVNDGYYDSIRTQVDKLTENISDIPESFVKPFVSTLYLTSDLPYYDYPQKMYEVITHPDNYSDEELRCVYHDIRLYEIEGVIDEKSFYHTLRNRFSENYFIRDILNYVEDGKYFGEISEWLHNRIKDVPAPRRYEVKDYQKRIYKYIKFLLDDRYEISIPKSHSEYIRKIS